MTSDAELADRVRADFPSLADLLDAHAGDPHWLDEVLPGAGAPELDQREAALGTSLPRSYRRLLALARGFWLAGGTVQLGEQHPFFHDDEKRYLCFAETHIEADGDQSVFLMETAGEGDPAVALYNHDDAGYVQVADGLPEWFGWLETRLRRCGSGS